MINEITHIEDSNGGTAAYLLSDRDDITTVNLNRCLRAIFDKFVGSYRVAASQIAEASSSENKLKFSQVAADQPLTEEDDMNMGFEAGYPQGSVKPDPVPYTPLPYEPDPKPTPEPEPPTGDVPSGDVPTSFNAVLGSVAPSLGEVKTAIAVLAASDVDTDEVDEFEEITEEDLVKEHGNFSISTAATDDEVEVKYLNYPSQIYRSVRVLGYTETEMELDKRCVDDLVSGGMYYDEPIAMRKAADPSDSVFGVVGRLWNHSAETTIERLTVVDTDQIVSSGGWMAMYERVDPVCSYVSSLAMSDFAPTVDSLYANEFPFMLFNILGDAEANVESGTYIFPGFSNVSIDYNNVLLNSDLAISFGKISMARGGEAYQKLELEIDLKGTILQNQYASEVLFAHFGNGFCSGLTNLSYALTGGTPFAIDELIMPTVMQTGDGKYVIRDVTKTDHEDTMYFNGTTGIKKASNSISNVQVSNDRFDMFYICLYRIDKTKYANGSLFA